VGPPSSIRCCWWLSFVHPPSTFPPPSIPPPPWILGPRPPTDLYAHLQYDMACMCVCGGLGAQLDRSVSGAFGADLNKGAGGRVVSLAVARGKGAHITGLVVLFPDKGENFPPGEHRGAVVVAVAVEVGWVGLQLLTLDGPVGGAAIVHVCRLPGRATPRHGQDRQPEHRHQWE
jgi:hypothetical protein